MEQVQTDNKVLNSYSLGLSMNSKRWGILILAILFVELMVCSLLIQYVSKGSVPPPAMSGNFVMWSVGVVGFQLALVPTILVAFHNNFRIRLAISILLAVFFLGAHWVALYVSGIYPVTAFNQIAVYPLGFAFAIVPILSLIHI